MTTRLCLKIRYAAEDAALRALEDARHECGKPRRNVKKVETRVYFHAACDAWHLTSKQGTS